MGKFIITESEKQRIRLLYENVTLPAPSNFVKYMGDLLGISHQTMQAIDWSLYKQGSPGANTEIYNELSKKFPELKQALTTAMNNIKSDANKKSQVLLSLNGYKTAGMTKEQIDFLNSTKTQLQDQTQQPTQQKPTQQQSEYEKYKSKYGTQTTPTNVPVPNRPTLERNPNL